ncbi:hypothetical protein CGRA01v4_09802 [Colletotrichum graminicola]|nr:hypothetical protein CGRA01v4_09802 [Colletotrichum graminicola]
MFLRMRLRAKFPTVLMKRFRCLDFFSDAAYHTEERPYPRGKTCLTWAFQLTG